MIESNEINSVLKFREVTKTFPTAEGELTILDHIDFDISAGESVSITGPSGSGKTTLLGLAAGLDLPTAGEIKILDSSLTKLDEEGRTQLRQKSVGFVFQNFQLIPSLTALENVAIPLELLGARNVQSTAMSWLDQVGLADRASHYPLQLSGGEQQRVAIARASVHQPAILFADEPTGNLDEETSHRVEEILFQAHRDTGNTLIVVTHDPELAAKTDRILPLKAGRLVIS